MNIHDAINALVEILVNNLKAEGYSPNRDLIFEVIKFTIDNEIALHRMQTSSNSQPEI